MLHNVFATEEEAQNKDEEASHHHEDRQVEGRSSMHESREGIVPPLNYRNFVVQMQVRNAVLSVLNLELEDSKALRRAEHRRVSSILLCLAQTLANVRL